MVVILLALAGCATTTLAPPGKDAAAKSFATTEGHANVYVYRRSAAAGAEKYVVSLDGRRVGESATGTFLHLVVVPGPHTILVSEKKTEATLAFTADAGTNVFIQVDPRPGPWPWFWPTPTTLHLVQVSDQEGAMQDVRTCDLAGEPE